MIAVDRIQDRLVVSERPSALYRLATCACMFAAVFAIRGVLQLQSTLESGLLALEISVMFALLWNWRTTAYRFDRGAGTLVIARSGLVRAEQRRDLTLGEVKAVLDRRSGPARAIELLLTDRSTLVVARARRASQVLDSVARELSDLLQKPVYLAQQTLIAQRFEIQELVGEGGMGLVYRALDRESASLVALKLELNTDGDAQQAARFLREMALLEQLDHPRICRHVSHGTAADGRAYLAMQWLDGEDLRVALTRGPLSLPDSLHVLRGAAEALTAVHAAGVVHRDLKPGNLFLRNRSPADLVLLDFGIARSLDRATRLTGTQGLVGTPHYMAPEQASSASALSPAADVFSLGCIFYECLTGKPPFDAPQVLGVLARILFDNPEPAEALRPGIPAAWLSLLQRMLAKGPSERPTDAATLLAELTALPEPGHESIPPRAPPQEARDSGDRVLVSVVLATLRNPVENPARATARFLAIRGALGRFRCAVERLADGSLLVSVLPRHSATDQARVAARCALLLRELAPEAAIAVATGRAPLRESLRVGEVVDRAVGLLEHGSSTDVRLDSVSAGLLEAHFITRVRDGVTWLVAERQELDESRPLLGKPTPCVGRELELAQLEGLMASVVDDKLARAAVVLGEPGIGKSRLRHELLRRVRERHAGVTMLGGYGDPLSAGSPYVLIADALQRHANLARDPEAARADIVANLCRHVEPAHAKRVSEFLGELCGVPFPGEDSAPLQAARADHRVMSEQITAAFVDWLRSECAAAPLLLVLDDVQWADALTVKLLEVALRELAQQPLFVLAFGRPESDQTFPKLLGPRTFSLSLSALSDKACEQLITRVLGPALTEDARRRVARLAGGNALFLEELIRAASEGEAGDVPETVLAMLQARLSRLSPEARMVMRAASVLGEHFWASGVARIADAWAVEADITVELAELVESELIAQDRDSRFAGEQQYSFRHALVCDAAYGLSTEADRRAAHVCAGDWLEQHGETDGVVLARHAEEAGDLPRAVRFYSVAAEQSLGRHDFQQALVRAARGTECGAQGEQLGVLDGIRTSALYSMGRWRDAADSGAAALSRLPRAGSWWCATVEMLMQVLPNVGDLAGARALSDQLLQIKPGPEARDAYLRALQLQLLGYAVSAAHTLGQRTLDFIDQLGTDYTEHDAASRGYARLWRSVYSVIASEDLEYALQLSEQAVSDLAESQVLYRLSLAYTVQAFACWSLGLFERGAEAARKGRATAQQIHDDYHDALAGWYLSLPLTDMGDPAVLDEAEHAAGMIGALQDDNVFFRNTSLNTLARVSLARGDLERALTIAKTARVGNATMLPYGLIASTTLLRTLAALGRWDEACVVAREDLQALARASGPMVSEVMFLVHAAEVLSAAGHHEEARPVLAQALQKIQLRADKIQGPALRQTYLTRRPENVRARELLTTSAGSSP